MYLDFDVYYMSLANKMPIQISCCCLNYNFECKVFPNRVPIYRKHQYVLGLTTLACFQSPTHMVTCPIQPSYHQICIFAHEWRCHWGSSQAEVWVNLSPYISILQNWWGGPRGKGSRIGCIHHDSLSREERNDFRQTTNPRDCLLSRKRREQNDVKT